MVLVLLVFSFFISILSAEMIVSLWAKTKRKCYWNITFYTNILFILFIFGRNNIFGDKHLFCYIFRNCHWEVLYKILVERAAFLLKLQNVRIIQKFPRIFRRWLIIYNNLCRHILKHASVFFFFFFFFFETK